MGLPGCYNPVGFFSSAWEVQLRDRTRYFGTGAQRQKKPTLCAAPREQVTFLFAPYRTCFLRCGASSLTPVNLGTEQTIMLPLHRVFARTKWTLSRHWTDYPDSSADIHGASLMFQMVNWLHPALGSSLHPSWGPH